MPKVPEPGWLSTRDIAAVDVNRRVILFRAKADMNPTKESELDVPVHRLTATTFKLDRTRINGQSISVYCPVLTVY